MGIYIGPSNYYGTSDSGISGSHGATGVSGQSGTCGNARFSTSSSIYSGLTYATWNETYTKELPILEDFEIIEIKKERKFFMSDFMSNTGRLKRMAGINM